MAGAPTVQTMLAVRRAGLVAALCGATAGCGADERGEPTNAAGDPRRGLQLIQSYGCGSCHTIPDVPRARGQVGPPLEGIANRAYLGGVAPNTPANMVVWIRAPQSVEPRTAMPDLGVSESDARDMTAYLYTLK
jgi:cytochrome c